MSQNEKIIHLAAGGIGGTVGAIITCPLEVIKTRLQASNSSSRSVVHTFAENEAVILSPYSGIACHAPNHMESQNKLLRYHPFHAQRLPLIDIGPSALTGERQITENEGYRALFKGLGPNLIGVAPTRAIYFCTYSWAKSTLNSISAPDTPLVHLLSASCAGFVSCSLTNPIWFVKTRIQLSRRPNMTASECVRRVYKEKGFLGFYKGITASYFGISETVIHFVIYEAVKAKLQRWQCCCEDSQENHEKPASSLFSCMIAGGISKTIASCVAYPHEVARTRLREENSLFTGFFQTLQSVAREDGIRGLYRGLGTQLLRQVPNTAIMMTTYEACVYLFRRWRHNNPSPVLCTVFEDEEGQFYVHNASAILSHDRMAREG